MARYKPLPGARLPALLRELRMEAGYSAAQFADQLEVSEYTILAGERRVRCPSQAVLNAYGRLADRKQTVSLPLSLEGNRE